MNDPVHVLGVYLAENGLIDEAGIDELRASVKAEIEEALAAAWETPDPEPASAMLHVFAETAIDRANDPGS